MKRCLSWFVVVAGLWVCACGSDTPTTPTTTTTSVPALSISPSTSVLAVGQTQTFTAADAASTAVITWASSDSSILTIDSGGNAVAIARGTVTITMSADGQTATLQVQVVPSYQGEWTGDATVTACTDIAGFASMNYCAQRIRTKQRLTLNLTQNGLAITGAVYKAETGGQVGGSVSGSLSTGGELSTLVATLTGVVSGIEFTHTVISWNALATGDLMTGSFAANVTSAQVIGIATLQWQFTSVARTVPKDVRGDGSSRGAAPFLVQR